MGENGSPLHLVAQAAVQKTIVHAASAQLVITCRCGNPTPLQVQFIPGHPIVSQCPACQTQFLFGRFIFDFEKNPGELHVGVREVAPTIVVPRTM